MYTIYVLLDFTGSPDNTDGLPVCMGVFKTVEEAKAIVPKVNWLLDPHGVYGVYRGAGVPFQIHPILSR